MKVLRSQIVVGLKYSTGFADNATLTTLANTTINISLNNGTGQWQIGNSTLLINDVLINNGVLHIVDSLFFAQNLTANSSNFQGSSNSGSIAGKNASSSDLSSACKAKNCSSPSLCCDVAVNDVLNVSAVCYDPLHFVCAKRGNFLCGTSAPLICGDQCYSDSRYRCLDPHFFVQSRLCCVESIAMTQMRTHARATS